MDLVTTVQLLGNLGESIAAIAVVATLFYLALQVREGKKAAEANTESLDQSRQVAMAQVLRNRVRTNAVNPTMTTANSAISARSSSGSADIGLQRAYAAIQTMWDIPGDE